MNKELHTATISETEKIKKEMSSNYDYLKSSLKSITELTLKGNASVEKINTSVTQSIEDLNQMIFRIKRDQNLSNEMINEIFLYIKDKKIQEEKVRNRWMFFRAILAVTFSTMIVILSFIGLISLID